MVKPRHRPRSALEIVIPLVVVVVVSAALVELGVATVVRQTDPSKLQTADGAKDRLSRAYAQLPMSFTMNRGQAPAGVDFVSAGPGYRLSLSPDQAVLSVAGTSGRQGATVGMKLVGADASARAADAIPLPGKANFVLGADPARWHTGVPTFAKVLYRGVYPGVNVAYYGRQGELEYDLVVAPGADPSVISLAFSGVERLSVEGDGELVLTTHGGELRQRQPHLYQEDGEVRRDVAGSFVVRGPSEVGFTVGPHDPSLPLVIDPMMVYSTFLGGSGNEEGGYSIAVDASGSAYVTGGTANPGQGGGSTDFPTTPGAYQSVAGDSGEGDAFVTKLSSDGSTVLYSTYIGGSGFDDGAGIAVNGLGEAYVRGVTDSTDFPTTDGVFQRQKAGPSFNVWVAKLSADGSQLGYATYLGGVGFNSGSGLAIDGSGSAYVTGITGAADFPTTPSAFDTNFHGRTNVPPPPFSDHPDDYDAFVTKLTPDGSGLVYSTFLGGNRLDGGFGITVDKGGNAYIVGDTRSPSFPASTRALDRTFNGDTDAFVAKLDPAGSRLVYATFLGGSGFDDGLDIAIDSAGNAYATGGTASADFPTTPGAFQSRFSSTLPPPPQPCTPISPPPCGPRSAYVSKVKADGSSLGYSTFLGGSVFDFGMSIDVDRAGAASITGGTFSPDFPVTPRAPQPSLGGDQDGFVTKLAPDGSGLAGSTFLGGSGFDQGVGLAVDSRGSVYVTGATSSPNFPTTPQAFQPALRGEANGFVTKLRF